jgi:hypothetical protein
MEGRSLNVFTALQSVAAATLLWFLISWAALWNMQRYVGSVLVGVGVAFTGVARYQLGKSFSLRPKENLSLTGSTRKSATPFTSSAQ